MRHCALATRQMSAPASSRGLGITPLVLNPFPKAGTASKTAEGLSPYYPAQKRLPSPCPLFHRDVAKKRTDAHLLHSGARDRPPAAFDGACPRIFSTRPLPHWWWSRRQQPHSRNRLQVGDLASAISARISSTVYAPLDRLVLVLMCGWIVWPRLSQIGYLKVGHCLGAEPWRREQRLQPLDASGDQSELLLALPRRRRFGVLA